ncbi:MAG: outer membrane protein insertion porin family [Rhodothermales bacterium]|jgi:outer membrane protein insertion porin family
MCRTYSRISLPGLLVFLWSVAALAASAQDPLTLIDGSTQTKSVRFRFLDQHEFHADQLTGQMITRGSTFADRLRTRLAFLPFVEASVRTFDPVELQRDMARLRRFYVRNGFLRPRIDYPATQFKRSSNKIRVIVNVDEGPPLAVVDREIRMTPAAPAEHSDAWLRLLQRAPLPAGSRYSEFNRLQLEATVRGFWRDRGYAFAEVRIQIMVDSLASRVNLALQTDLGPLARVDSILVEGNLTIDRSIVLRELPFESGDIFSAADLVEGQRSLFRLNLFRVALVETPEQTRDSLVTVRVRLREAEPRHLRLDTGYSREDGAILGANWRHRNFLGGARVLSVSGSAQSGLLARPAAARLKVKSYTASISVGHPYAFTRKLSTQVAFSGTTLDDPNQGTKYRKIGVTPSLLYEVLPFRSASLQYSLSQAEPLDEATSLVKLGIFSRDVIGATFTAGRLDNYLNPTRGWIVRPSFELAGALISRDMAYRKASIDAFAYVPLSRRTVLSLSVSAGRLTPTGPSRNQSDPQTEFQFDDVRFYAGGASTLRGWGLNLAGPQAARADSVTVAGGITTVHNARFEAIGGLGELTASVELVFPVGFLGSAWRGATFLDFGGVSARLVRDSEGRTVFDANDQPRVDDRAFPALSDLHFAAGAGIRLQTPVGAIRLDLAYKLNPSGSDLTTPAPEVLFDRGLGGAAEERQIRRLNFHVGIHRAF